MNTPDRTARIVQKIAEAQPRIFAFVMTLLPDFDRANDVLQETNLVIWQKADEYDESRDFAAWACTIARYQVLAHLRDRGRDRLALDPAVIQMLADEAEHEAGGFDDRRRALRMCLNRLNTTHREMVLMRYAPNVTVADIARQFGRSAASISTTLLRIRKMLAECIQNHMKSEASS